MKKLFIAIMISAALFTGLARSSNARALSVILPPNLQPALKSRCRKRMGG